MSTEWRIYTMPQSFMDDKSVPTHWRLLWLLNWFFLNGNSVWKSNATLWKELWVSERSVTRAIVILEKMQLIFIRRTKTSRTIEMFFWPKNIDSRGVDTNVEGGRHECLPNSVSIIQKVNSESIIHNHDSEDFQEKNTRKKWSIKERKEIIIDFENKELQKTWEDFQDYRKEIKKAITDQGKKNLLKKLNQYSPETATKMLEESMINWWQWVFELKWETERSKKMQQIANYNFT